MNAIKEQEVIAIMKKQTTNEELENQLKEINKEKEFYKLIADNTSSLEGFRDETGKLVYINKAFETISGFNRNHYLSGAVSLYDIIHPDDQEKFKENFETTKKNGNISSCKLRIIGANKKIRHLDLNCTPVFLDGKMAGVRMSGKDITDEENLIHTKKLNTRLEKLVGELRVSQKEAEESNRKFKNLFLSMQEGVYLHELIYNNENKAVDYRIIEANPGSEKHLGIKPEEAIGKIATKLYNVPEPPFFDIYRKVTETGETIRFEHYFEPMNKWFNISAFKLEEGKFATIFSDITERINSEKTLMQAKEKAEESELKFRTIIDTIPDVVWLKDSKGIYLSCNKRFEDLYAAPENKIIGKTDYDFVDKEQADLFRMNDKMAQDSGGPYKNEELVCFKNDGHQEYLETIKTPMYGINRQLVGILGIGRNITERKLVEEALLKAKERAEEADRAKSVFLSNMSHEIRTPMNGIIGFADLLDDKNLNAEQQNHYIKIIKSSGYQLLRIIDDILEISRLETKKMKAVFSRVCINEVLSELHQVFSLDPDKKQVPLYLKTYFSDEESYIETDRSKLIKILSNLLDNAFRYTSEGYVETGYYPDGDRLVLYVRDTGIGIPISKQKSVFERFIQAEEEISKKAGGLGLGLSIVKENTTLLGGEIRLESEPGKGTTFYIALPFKKASPS